MRITCAENKADKDFRQRTRQRARFKCREKGLWAEARQITTIMCRGKDR
jgi:hypothetical protein